MPEGDIGLVLARLLPPWSREWFLPAWHELRLNHVERADPSTGRAALRGRLLLLYLDCWRLALLDTPRHLLELAAARAARPPRERLHVFLYQLRHAFRSLRREPGFAFSAVLTLTLGVGANVAVFSLVEATLLRPLPYQGAGELVVLRHRDQHSGITKQFIAMGDYVDLAQRQKSFEEVGAWGSQNATVYGEDESYQVPALYANSALLEALRMRPVLGRGFGHEDDLPEAATVAVLGNELWRTRFGSDPGVIGRTIRLDGTTAQIVGVAPPGFRFPPDASTGIVLSMGLPLEAPTARKSSWTFALARLKPGQTLESATSELAALSHQMEQEHPAANEGSQYYAVSLRDELVGSTRTALLLMLAAVGTVLLIACGNVTNLLLLRALGRQRDMAVRITLGAGRGRLVGEMLAESLAIALVAGTAGVLLAPVSAHALVGLLPASLVVPGLNDVGINLRVLGFTAGITLVTALLCGAMAAFAAPFAHAGGLLVVAGRATMSRGARRATSGLVAAEMALAVVLLVGAGLILRTFAGLLAVDPGFRSDGVLTMAVAIPSDRYTTAESREAFWSRALPALGAVAGVRDVGTAVVVPLTGNNWTAPFMRADQPVVEGERPPEVGWQLASGGYFRALGIPLVEGRLFTPADGPSSPPVVIISEGVRHRFFDDQPAVGRQIRVGQGQTAEIVGVVGDIRRAGLTDEPRADLYFAAEHQPSSNVTLFVRTAGDPAQLVGPLRDALRTIEPNVVVQNTRTMTDVVRASMAQTRLLLWLLGVFAAVALGLAAVGIYGAMAYAVRRQNRELATRIALGATRTSILWLVLRNGALLAGVGIGAGVIVGLGAARTLRSVLYGVTAADPAVVVMAAVILAATALIACSIPALRATRVDPASALAEM